MPDCPPGHNEYGSDYLAKNAKALHEMKNPTCGGVEQFPCGDHFHIGHKTPTIGQACKAEADRVYAEERERHVASNRRR